MISNLPETSSSCFAGWHIVRRLLNLDSVFSLVPKASKNEDWSISKIVKTIRASDVFTSLPRREQYSKELSVGSMKEFFKTNAFYKKYVHVNSSTKKVALGGWRLKVIDREED